MSDKILKLNQAQTLYNDLRERIEALPTDNDIPTKISDLTDDSGHYTKPATGIPASDLEEEIVSTIDSKAPAIWKDVNGSIVHFEDGAENMPLRECVVQIEPVQSGSGDPSPENVRPITGWTGATIYHSGADASDADEISITFPAEAGTVYGGTLDVVRGTLTVTWGILDLGARNWSYIAPTASIPYGTFYNTILEKAIGQFNLLCESYPVKAGFGNDGAIQGNSATNTVYITDSRFNGDAAALKQSLSGVMLAYALNTPITCTLTPQEIRTLLGTNNIWADTGDIAVTYPADTKMFVEQNTPDVPVQDVQVNGVSVLTDGVANVPKSGGTSLGVVKARYYGVRVNSDGELYVSPASITSEVKPGSSNYLPIVPGNQHAAAFYGLAKAAGDTTQSQSSNSVGDYTDNAKEKIQSMLGISQMLAPTNPNLVASQAYSIGDVFAANSHLYKATAAIAQDGAIIPDTNCVETTMADESVRDVQVNGVSVLSNGVANVPTIGVESYGVAKIGYSSASGLEIASNGNLKVSHASANSLKAGTNSVQPITPDIQHSAAFYGLAKAAGADEKDSTLPVGQYTDTAKSAIRTMIGASSTNVIAVQDTQPTDTDTKIWLPETAETPIQIPTMDDMNTALAGKVGDVQVNGTSIVNNGVASIPIATDAVPGVVKIGSGLFIDSNTLFIARATNNQIKEQVANYVPIVPSTQYMATFYGLAKAAGDITQSASSNAVGVYTDSAKASIKSMLGIVDGSTGTVDVTGTTPTITAVENTRYVCGEVTSLDFTPAASGICIVRFTSGSTVTVLTLPSTVKFPEWFDPTTLETNTTYEICITDGVYGAVMSWAQ